MLHCQVFMRAIHGRPEWRGTVERDGQTIWTGPWRSDQYRATWDAERAAHGLTIQSVSGSGVPRGPGRPAWPTRTNKIIY